MGGNMLLKTALGNHEKNRNETAVIHFHLRQHLKQTPVPCGDPLLVKVCTTLLWTEQSLDVHNVIVCARATYYKIVAVVFFVWPLTR